jgi:hypothetical protein
MLPFDDPREDAGFEERDLEDVDFVVFFVAPDRDEADVDVVDLDDADRDRPPEPLPCPLAPAIPLPLQRTVRARRLLPI